MNDRSRQAQKWVTEEFYKVLDVFGFRAVMFFEWGFRPRVNMPGKSPQADRSGLYNQRHQPNKRVSPCPPKHNVIF